MSRATESRVSDRASDRAGVLGILLAAGAGRRMGGPKALVVGTDSRPWLETSTYTLLDGGCARVVVVLGAQADLARPLVPVDPRVEVVEAPDWDEGMGASLRRGLAAAQLLRRNGIDVEAAVVSLVDLPDVDARVVARLIATALPPLPGSADPADPAGGADGGVGGAGADPSGSPAAASSVLARAGYRGRPGHPVILGVDHWAAVLASARGDHGAREYLADRPVLLVECGDLATGRDVDRPV